MQAAPRVMNGLELLQSTDAPRAARTKRKADEVASLELLPENVIVHDVFRCCQQQTHSITMSPGMGASITVPVLTGISAQEVRAACELLAVPQKRWKRVSRGVLLMGSVFADVRNEQTTKPNGR